MTFGWKFALVLLCGWAGGSCSGAEPKRPNIVLLVADDLGYAELGCQGNKDIPTPNLDALAAGGVRFTNGYVTAPFCAPSRAGLMMGKYQNRFGFEFNPVGVESEDPRVGLPAKEASLPQALMDAGYATALIGKWHLGATAANHPLRKGFDEFFGFLHEGHYYVPPPYDGVYSFFRRRVLPDGASQRWTSSDGRLTLSNHSPGNEWQYDASNPLYRNGQPIEERDYLTDALTREAMGVIERNKDRPFFLYVAYNAIHAPMQARAEDVERFASIPDLHRRIFAGMLSRLDESVGHIVEALRKTGELDNTLIFFISDNGGPTRELTSSNRPLRGEKGQLYEGGIRVPFLMAWKDKISEGQVCDVPVIALDIFATCLAAAGRDPAKLPERIDGVSLIPSKPDAAIELSPRDLYWRMGDKTALRSGDWKIVRGELKGSPDWELYQLYDDVSEAHNLAAQRPEVVRDLNARWQTLNDQMQPARWVRDKP